MKLTNLKIIYLLFVIQFIASCKKDIIEPVDSPPVFYFTGDVAGTAKSFSAGINNYFMYSALLHDANSIYNFDSHLKIFDCSICTDNIQIIIKDYQASTSGDAILFANSISPGYYPYEVPGGAPVSADVQFTTTSSPGVASYYWDFGDGTNLTTASSIVTHTYGRHGKYQACLTTTFLSSETSTICQEVKIEIPDNGCQFNFTPNSSSGTTVDFTSNEFMGVGPYTYLWDFGDGVTSTLANPSHTYSTAGAYLVCQKVIDANGAESNFCKNIKTLGSSALLTNFSNAQIGTTPNPFSLNNVVVNYTDSNGIIYSTLSSFSQIAGNYFKVISVDDYEPNENGLPTKKININFRCTLFNGSNSIFIDNGAAVIAVAYQ